jgi:hypothetical protein
MRYLENCLNEVAGEIKKDFGLPEKVGMPSIEICDSDSIQNVYEIGRIVKLVEKGHVPCKIIINKRRGKISNIVSPITIEENWLKGYFHTLFGEKEKEIKEEDKPKAFTYQYLTPIFLNEKFNLEIPKLHPHLSLLHRFYELWHTIRGMTENVLIRDLDPVLNRLEEINHSYESLRDNFIESYQTKKLMEAYPSLTKAFSQHEEVGLRACLSNLRNIGLELQESLGEKGLELQGRHSRTIFSKSSEEFLSHTSSRYLDLLWIYGIDDLLIKILWVDDLFSKISSEFPQG